MSQIVFQQEMFFEKQENKKVKHTKKKKTKTKKLYRNYDHFILCAKRTTTQLGAHYVNCLKVSMRFHSERRWRWRCWRTQGRLSHQRG